MGTIAVCAIGAGIWFFLTSDPSELSWALVGFFIFFLILGFVVWRVFRTPDSEPEPEVLPPPQIPVIEVKKSASP